MSKTTANKSAPSEKSSGLSIYLRLLQYVKKHSFLLIIAIIGFAVVALTNLAFTALLIPLIDDAFAADSTKPIIWIPIATALIFLVRSFGSFLGLYFTGSVGQQVVKVLRGEMHEKLLYLPAEYYDSASSGQLLSKFSFDVERVTWATSKSIPILVRDSSEPSSIV